MSQVKYRVGICSVCQSEAPVFSAPWDAPPASEEERENWRMADHTFCGRPCEGIHMTPEHVFPDEIEETDPETTRMVAPRTNQDGSVEWKYSTEYRCSLPHYCPSTGDKIVMVVYDKPEAATLVIEELDRSGDVKYAHLCLDWASVVRVIRKLNNRM